MGTPSLSRPAHDRLLKQLGARGVSLFAIRQWRVLVVACFTLSVLGIMAWRALPRFEDPDVDVAEALVVIPYPGASADDVNDRVVRVLEPDLQELDALTTIESSALAGSARFHLTFVEGTAMDAVLERIRGKILAKKDDLPEQLRQPILRQVSTSYIVQMVVAVSGHRNDAVLHDVADHLRTDLQSIPGVSTVVLRGDRKRAIRVDVDPARLEAHHLTAGDVIARARAAIAQWPVGRLGMGGLDASLRVAREADDTADLGAVEVGRVEAQGVRTTTLADVADVQDDYAASDERFFDRGAPAIALEIRFQRSADAMRLGKAVRARVAHATAAAPEGVAIAVAHDQPEWTNDTVNSLAESLVEGVVLVAVVIALWMRLRAAAVVAAVLPLAIAGGLLGLSLAGCSLDKVSIAGLIVALGLLVDDAVVVVESVQLMRDRGLDAVRAAVAGTARVFWANNGTTAVACASFLPLFVMPGRVGRFVRGLPIAVVLCLVTSLLVAQLVTPWIAVLLVRPRPGTRPVPLHEDVDLDDDVGDIGEHEANAMLRGLKSIYLRVIPWVVRRPAVVVGAATLLLVGAASLIPRVGVEFFPKSDKRALFVRVELPRGAALETTAEKVAETMTLLRKDPAVEDASALVGGDYPLIFLGKTRHPQSTDASEILVRLRREEPTAVVARRLRRSLVVAGARVGVEELYDGTGAAHPIILRVYGDDPEALRGYAERVRDEVAAIPGTRNVADSLSDSQLLGEIALDEEQLARTGLSSATVGSELRQLYGGDKIGQVVRDGEVTDVVVSVPRGGERPIDRLLDARVRARGGQDVPLRALGSLRVTSAPSELKRRNGRAVVEVVADVEGVLPSKVLRALEPKLAAIAWKDGFGYELGGAREDTQTSFSNLAVAALGAIAIIGVLLVVMLESLSLALTVLVGVPYVLIGVVPALVLTRNAFGFMAFLGVVSLVGVYVNHKIYFVERLQTLVKRGVRWPDAIAQAGIDRMRPVVLTALTAVLGLVPLTLTGGSLWAPFGWVSIFGLLASIPLSLVVLPAFLSVTLRARGAVVGLARRREGDAEGSTRRRRGEGSQAAT